MSDDHKVTERTQLSAPQDVVDSIWDKFAARKPGFIHSILKQDGVIKDGDGVDGVDASDGSYGAAREACIREVSSIVRECERKNQMFTDSEFDILDDFDNKGDKRKYLYSLPSPVVMGTIRKGANAAAPNAAESKSNANFSTSSSRSEASLYSSGPPHSVRRVHEIFDNPSFAPQAPRRHLRSCGISRLLRPVFSRDLTFVKLWLQVTLIALTILRLFDFISPRAFFRHGSVDGFLLVGCFAMQALRKRVLGPSFAPTHIVQGYIGDCWWLASIATLCSRNDLMRKFCIAWDQDCGVYGFVFYKDGAWVHTVVDDRLYLKIAENVNTTTIKPGRLVSDRLGFHQDASKKGVGALYFAECGASYTWLPLCEKAYAKAHGDYEALQEGQMSEGFEDLTGGIGEVIRTSDIKDQERMWQELINMDAEHVYGLLTGKPRGTHSEVGISLNHAYSVEKACTFYLDGWKVKPVKLLKIRNPWGENRNIWQGDWGVGSSKWGPISTWWLGSQGNEHGEFYMTFEDALKTFWEIRRTSIYDERVWNCKQEWVSMDVDWISQNNPVFFELHLQTASKAAFAVSQLDTRYFKALRGRYGFHLHFGIKKKDCAEDDFIAQAGPAKPNGPDVLRSATVETTLECGIYEVLVKVMAVERDNKGGEVWSAEDVLKQSRRRPHKLQQTAQNYDKAHGKLKTLGPRTDKTEKTEGADSTSDKFVYPDPCSAAWNAVCGIGLRVFSKDPNMRLEARHRDEDKWAEYKDSSEKKDEKKGTDVEKTPDSLKITIEGISNQVSRGDSSGKKESGLKVSVNGADYSSGKDDKEHSSSDDKDKKSS